MSNTRSLKKVVLNELAALSQAIVLAVEPRLAPVVTQLEQGLAPWTRPRHVDKMFQRMQLFACGWPPSRTLPGWMAPSYPVLSFQPPAKPGTGGGRRSDFADDDSTEDWGRLTGRKPFDPTKDGWGLRRPAGGDRKPLDGWNVRALTPQAAPRVQLSRGFEWVKERVQADWVVRAVIATLKERFELHGLSGEHLATAILERIPRDEMAIQEAAFAALHLPPAAQNEPERLFEWSLETEVPQLLRPREDCFGVYRFSKRQSVGEATIELFLSAIARKCLAESWDNRTSIALGVNTLVHELGHAVHAAAVGHNARSFLEIHVSESFAELLAFSVSRHLLPEIGLRGFRDLDLAVARAALRLPQPYLHWKGGFGDAETEVMCPLHDRNLARSVLALVLHEGEEKIEALLCTAPRSRSLGPDFWHWALLAAGTETGAMLARVNLRLTELRRFGGKGSDLFWDISRVSHIGLRHPPVRPQLLQTARAAQQGCIGLNSAKTAAWSETLRQELAEWP